MKNVVIDGIEYYTRHHPRGYGDEIMKKEPREDDSERFNYISLFRSTNKELVKNLFKAFEAGNVLTDFPDTSQEVSPKKILVIRGKHGTWYYAVPTYEIANKTLRHYLKIEFEAQLNNMKPTDMVHNDSGVVSQEEIDSIPIDKVKEMVQADWDVYQMSVKDNKTYAREWENLRKVIEEDKGDAWYALAYFEAGNYDFETLETV